jgi:hypothetical protein
MIILQTRQPSAMVSEKTWRKISRTAALSVNDRGSCERQVFLGRLEGEFLVGTDGFLRRSGFSRPYYFRTHLDGFGDCFRRKVGATGNKDPDRNMIRTSTAPGDGAHATGPRGACASKVTYRLSARRTPNPACRTGVTLRRRPKFNSIRCKSKEREPRR